jgi:hypothetical protein
MSANERQGDAPMESQLDVTKAAYHECGHADGLHRQGNLARVYIEKDKFMDDWAGEAVPSSPPPADMETLITAFAGPLSEAKFLAIEQLGEGWSFDPTDTLDRLLQLQRDLNGKIPVRFVRGEERREVFIDADPAATDVNVVRHVLALANHLDVHEAIRLAKQRLDTPEDWQAIARLGDALAAEPIVVKKKKEPSPSGEKIIAYPTKELSGERAATLLAGRGALSQETQNTNTTPPAGPDKSSGDVTIQSE